MKTLLGFLAIMAVSTTALADDSYWVFVGTYTQGSDSKGIYRMELDPATGELSPPELAGEGVNPSFLAIHPDGTHLYAVGETSDFNGQRAGAVVAYALDRATGKLSELNKQASGGAGPCHLVVDKTGRVVLVANYGGGSTAAIRIGGEGRLGPIATFIQHEGPVALPKRQGGPHAHSVNVDAANRFAFVADLGLDKVLIYALGPATGSLKAHGAASVAPGSGPRHFAFHPDGKHAYVINEINCTVTAFEYDAAEGALKEIQTITTLPRPVGAGDSTAEIVVHPSGKFLYGSNRGHDSIAVFAIDGQTGKLTAVENEPTQGKTPRNFAIDPSGRWLLAENQDSDTIVVFGIDPQTGKLEATGTKVNVPRPVCIKFLKKGP